MPIKRAYVALMRTLRPLLGRCGLLAWLERKGQRRWSVYARSLFSIYDPFDLARLDLPWWTFSAVEATECFLAERDAPRAFEYGAGASTVWLARRCASVVSVEHDVQFANSIRTLLAPYPNVELRVVPPEPVGPHTRARSMREGYRHLGFDAYAASIREAGPPFDLIVIDGRAREACLAEAQHHLKPDGLIVLDNSDRQRYQPALSDTPLVWKRYRGLAPCLPIPAETMLLWPADASAPRSSPGKEGAAYGAERPWASTMHRDRTW